MIREASISCVLLATSLCAQGAPAASDAAPQGSGPTVLNLGIQVTSNLNLEQGYVLAGVAEGAQGLDLNGDGDRADSVVHVFDPASGLLNLEVAYSGHSASQGRYALFLASEEGQRVDWNEDGDKDDDVVFVHDRITKRTLNLGLAHPENGDLFVDGAHAVFPVQESSQGQQDLNGDGDSTDRVVHIVDLRTGKAVNLGLAARVNSIKVDRGSILMLVVESDQSADLNGDGDMQDHVLHMARTASSGHWNSGLSIAVDPQLEGDYIACVVGELSQGAADLNGDGDTDDFVVHVINWKTGAVTNLELAELRPVLRDGIVAFRPDESDGGADLNGDGDKTDRVVHVYDTQTGTLRNLGASCAFQPFTIESGSVVYAARDVGSLSSGDLNLYEPQTQVTTNVGLSVDTNMAVGSGLLAFNVYEAFQIDFNGDGDKSDTLLQVYDIASGQLSDVGLPSVIPVSISGELVYFSVPEGEQEQGDLNGDGDLDDLVRFVYDASTGSVQNLGLAYKLSGTVIVGTDVSSHAFQVWESAQGGTDLNGDGDSDDLVLHLAVH